MDPVRCERTGFFFFPLARRMNEGAGSMRAITPKPIDAETGWERKADHDAPPGNVLGALARLLRNLVKRERQEAANRAATVLPVKSKRPPRRRHGRQSA
jgi:hypothetical protein